MASHQHPPHPQFLDVDWPQTHDSMPYQPLLLENEYDIDPSRYDILQGQGELQHPSNIDRRRTQQGSGFPVNDFGRQTLGGNDDYVFTFPNPQGQSQQQQQQQQQFDQLYNGGQYYPDQTGQFPGISFGDANQPISSPSYYGGEEGNPYPYGQGQSAGIVQHARSASNPHPGPTPTVRSFPGERTPVYSNLSSPLPPDYGSSPNHGMGVHTGMAYQGHNHNDGSEAPHAAKRMRALDDGEGETSSVDGEAHEEAKEGSAKPPKPLGACARCKGLKVKCEFKTDPDVCKRCLNGGHECVIPGRKKRRAPPRRDLLLGQIREQAAKIEELMKQLEVANKRAGQKQGEAANAPSPPHSASASTTDLSNLSELTHSDIGTPEPGPEAITKPDVLDWIAKARESIEAFGGYINMGGPGVTKDLLSGDDPLGWRDSSSDSSEVEGETAEDQQDDHSDIHVKVEDVDGKPAPQRGRTRPEGPPASEASTSRAGDETSSKSSRRRRSRNKERLAILPVEAAPIGLLANMSLRKPRSRKSSRSRSVSTTDDNDNEYGVANEDYFRADSPGPDRPIMYEQHQTPYILRSGIVSPSEVERLFKIFFDYMNPSISLLDPVLYTAQKTYWRSPFLFTTILGVASRYYLERPELYRQAMNCARLAGGSTLIGGQKSVETVAAFLLLSLWPVPARKWEEDRGWVYLGLSIRIATDINLHHPHTVQPRNEQHAREMLNRTRMWLNCYNMDRSYASQYGKAPIINNADYIANHTEFWYKSSPYNIPDIDIHLCAYNSELKVLADYRNVIFSDPEHPVGLNKHIDVTAEATKTDDMLARLWETWAARLREEKKDTLCFEFRTNILKVAISYARVTVVSFAFLHKFGQDASRGFNDAFFWRCFRAAKDLVRTLLDELGAPHLTIFLRHASEAQCVFITFTCAFLIKLLHPRFAKYIPRETRLEMRTMVEDTANFLGSPEVAIDDRHGPKMYSRFLHGLLSMPLASVDYSPAALKKVMRSLAPSPASDSVSERLSTSPVPPVPELSTSPSPPAHEQTNAALSTDAQMFDGLGLQYQGYPSQPLDVVDIYTPPLPFDHEMLQSMQSLTDPAWQNMVLPGFSWIDAIQQDNDVQMRFNDSNLASTR
ncbi:hypothetical protein C8Q74DRAFT_1315611 [Fomes fomentarius]|nr:hypothetical protein C8Q74DRAFT_1315611 [Fomes fomentarius]